MKFKDYMKALPAARQAKIRARSRELLAEMNLASLREAAELTQGELAKRMRVSQVAISRMESRDDLLLSTFRRFIEAIGGRLGIVIELPGMRLHYGSVTEAVEANLSAPLHYEVATRAFPSESSAVTEGIELPQPATCPVMPIHGAGAIGYVPTMYTQPMNHGHVANAA